MKTALPEDIAEFAAVATKRLVRFGGPQAALQAETDDQLRQDARTALSDLGAFDLDVRSSSEDLLAAAVLCQAAGATALPYPLVEELLAIDGARLALVNPEAPRIDHGDLAGDWIAADLDGTRYQVQPSSRTDAKLGPFLVPATLSQPDGTVPAADVDLHLTLGSWRIVGAVQQALEITRQHVVARMQFGKPLAEFQAVRFTIADASVAVARASRTRQVHHQPDGIGSGTSAFGGCSDPSTQGRRDRAASAAHRAPVTGSAGLLRRVRCQRARPAHAAADPAAGQHRGARDATAARRPRRRVRDAVLRTSIGMSTEPVAAQEASDPLDEGIPFGTKLQQLAEQRCDDTALTVIARDGTEHSMTFAELDGRANQWGRALTASGAEIGSLVALAIPNSEQLVLAVLGCWKIGAVPVPMRWDLPDWERSRVLEVIDPAVAVDEQTLSTLTALRRRPVRRPAADGGFPQRERNLQQRIHRPARR